ncbi:MAG TPA: ATP-binding cassette domain-containing protein, partial [Microbacterium sp.]|nr:ATP-binding cassette domain-containing protein [Microbacterium sp.]
MSSKEGLREHGDAESADTTEGPVLSVKGLSVEFWVGEKWAAAAKHVTYDLMPGEVLAIVGESGSGKSTSSMAIMGLLPKNARITGSAKLAGRELIGAPDDVLRKVRGEGISVIFQEPMTALNPVYTIGFQISETLLTHRPHMTRKQAKERAIELLGLVEMPDPPKAYNSYPHQLSGGQRQRAMVAQSICLDPRVLIADEPTTALDVTVQAEILDLMAELGRETGTAMVLITHDMGVIARLADRVCVMKDGAYVEEGSVEDIFRNPQTDYTRALLAAIPRLDRDDRGGRPTIEPVAADAPVVVEGKDVKVWFPIH